MNELTISPWLLEKIIKGETILFLGAGAAIGCDSDNGSRAVTGNELRDLLSDEFLGGAKKNWPLSRVADYAKILSSIVEVQKFIRERFEHLRPADFHLLIPKFKWHSIITTNYDLIIEKAYEIVESRLQELKPIISDKDNFDQIIQTPKSLPFLKLHGCISRVNDQATPLILGSEEYAKYEENRRNLFGHLKEWGLANPIIFCGYEIEDPNIQQILFDLNDQGIHRPIYAIVKPDIDNLDERIWQSRRFDTIKADFSTFLEYLDINIDKKDRALASIYVKEKHPIGAWISSDLTPSTALTQYLDEELDLIHSEIALEGVEPTDFYGGLADEWSVYRENMDVRRNITDDLIMDCFLSGEDQSGLKYYLLKGHAGSGKNVTLRRASWDAALYYELPVFFLREGGILRFEEIEEASRLLNRRIFVIIDDVIQHLQEVKAFHERSINSTKNITFLFGSRINEWNVKSEPIANIIEQEYELRDLSVGEIDILLHKLEEHNCLGYLKSLNHDERKALFKLDADRQLLVALHEATSGKPFEEIVYDEYKNIYPEEAKVLYLDICTLHRLDSLVRVGLISRISGITFEDFKEHLFKPLEKVVKSHFDKRSRDYVYRSRHPLIAKFVFEKAVPTPEDRQNQIIRLLQYLNTDFKWDEEAFAQLINGRELAELFSDRINAENIFSVAMKTGGNEAHIYHQRANFEQLHPSGSLKKAMEYIRQAQEHRTWVPDSIQHTKAMILRRMANETDDNLEKAKYRNDAKELLTPIAGRLDDPHGYFGLVQLLVDEIKDIADSLKVAGEIQDKSELQKKVETNLISRAEEAINIGLQKYPNDKYILGLRADLTKILNDEPQLLSTLEDAFKANPAATHISIRLATQYMELDRLDDALTTLKSCKEHNPTTKSLNLMLAKVYLRIDAEEHQDIILHLLKRSFTEGDTNYESQVMYARQQYLFGDKEEAHRVFDYLRKQRFAPWLLKKLWEPVLDSEGLIIEYTGWVKRKTDVFCFINVPTLGEHVYIHYSRFLNSMWDKVAYGSEIAFNLAFTVRGAAGFNARVVG